MWIEIINKADVKKIPPIEISPPPRYEFELRAIVWSTKECVYKDEEEKCNDVFVRAGPGN